ncbi:hypothetical protein Esti_006433 [Eimeria stiedai]
MLQNLKKNLFGADPAETLADAVKEQRRRIARSLRSLERQHAKAEGEERKVFAELKAQALAGRVDKLQTKQLLVVRRRRAALLRCKAQLGAADIQATFHSLPLSLLPFNPLCVQQQQATQELHRHFQGCAKLLSLVNKTVDLPSVQLAVKGFNRESQKLGLMDEILNEVLEDGTAQLEDEEETEEELLREIVECAETEIEQQLTAPVRHVPAQQQLDPLPQKQQQQQQQLPTKHQQQQQRSSGQQQRISGQQHPQTALHASSSSRRCPASPWTLSGYRAPITIPLQPSLSLLECTCSPAAAAGAAAAACWFAAATQAALAEKLDQRLGSLLR